MNGCKKMHSKLKFVSASILDTQLTIRAIDVKVAALLVGILAPLHKTSRIFSHLDHFWSQSPRWIFATAVVLFILLWLFALASLVRAIGAVDNPSKHIINITNCRGTFYGEGLYKLGIFDVFVNRDIITASKDPKSFSDHLPTNEAEIELELVYEKLKLAYIRDIKIYRLNWGLRFSLMWLVIGIVIYLSSKYILN